MRAYAVFAGGGAKGFALAGALAAVRDKGIRVDGFGGTSAGSLVALLGSLDYSSAELRSIIVEQDFDLLLDDAGRKRRACSRAAKRSPSMIADLCWPLPAAICHVLVHLGLYPGIVLRSFLFDRIAAKFPSVAQQGDVTFGDLAALGCQPLKVVASDITLRAARVFDFGTPAASVLTAVRSSVGFPFAFRPVLDGDTRLVDGGLASNMPAFLFEEEHRSSRIPVLAFDLVGSELHSRGRYTLWKYLLDLYNTALSASDILVRGMANGVVHIPIETDPAVSTLDFGLSRMQRQGLFDSGYRQAAEQLERLPLFRIAREAGANIKRELIARFGPPALYEAVLAAVARDIEQLTGAADVRAHIMLPTQRGSRVIVYGFGMDHCTDADLELGEDAGCSGQAWKTKEPAVADLVIAKASAGWGMSPEQHARVPPDRKAMISVPIPGRWRLSSATPASPLQDAAVLGTLSVDSSTPLADTSWKEDATGIEVLQTWAEVVGRIIP